MTRVLLVNMPFAGVAHPSIALGLFKAQFELEGIACDVAYLNVRFAQMVGWQSYGAVQVSSALLAGEQMFAHELFDGYIPSYPEYDAAILPKVDASTQDDLRHLKAHVRPFLDNCLERVAWRDYDLIGFSSVFEQNLSSLALAYRVKKRYPEKIIVFGGANCEDVMGLSLHRCFPFVDFVCTGEANLTFPELVKRLTHGHPVEDLPGIVYRSRGRSIDTGPPEKVPDLDSLPFPDYDDYFETLRITEAPATLAPSVAIETARGCWWGEKAMCTFCGLNGQSIAFRAKSAERAFEEIVHLAARYPVRSVRAVDNMMPPSYFEDLLPKLAAARLDVDFFYEIRPNLEKRQIEALARARVTTVQAGVENLSTNILRLMRKGTTALRNIEFLKWCHELGVDVDWNLLFGFPGESLEDYARAFELASLVTHLKPPSSVGSIRLDRFSPNFENAAEIGLTNVRPWQMFEYVYPFERETLMDLVYFFDSDNESAVDDRGYTDRLLQHVSEWQSRNDRLTAERRNGSIVVRDTRPVARRPETVLERPRADVYEYCDARRQPGQILEWLRKERGVRLEREELARILDGLVASRLMVEEKGWYLSLALLGAVKKPLPGPPPRSDLAC